MIWHVLKTPFYEGWRHQVLWPGIYNNIHTHTHTHTETLQEETLCQFHFLSVSKPFTTLPASLYESPSKIHQRLTNQNRPPPKQFGSFPAGLSLFVMHILLHGFPSETPPTSSFCVRAKITLKALDKVSLEAKPHWKRVLHQTCHHGRHVTDTFCFGHAQQKPCTAKQSAQRLMILMRMSLAKPESSGYPANHTNGPMVLFYSTWMAWVGAKPPTLPLSSQQLYGGLIVIHSYTYTVTMNLMFWQADSVLCFFSMVPWSFDSTGDSRMQNHGEDDSRFHTGFR